MITQLRVLTVACVTTSTGFAIASLASLAMTAQYYTILHLKIHLKMYVIVIIIQGF